MAYKYGCVNSTNCIIIIVTESGIVASKKCYQEEGDMTRGSIREYAEAVRGRYFLASKKQKGKILDEFTRVTGCHRKAAIRLFRRGNQPRTNKKRGRPRRYGANVTEALRVAWEATDRLCSKRLHPFLPELVQPLDIYSELAIITSQHVVGRRG